MLVIAKKKGRADSNETEKGFSTKRNEVPDD